MPSTGGFPGTTGPGSVFFAAQGDALSTAINSGWLEDQSLNYASGVFATRAFVNGTTSFISTGDGTAFYVPGRLLRIAQGTSTTFSVVAESSFSAGQTIVRVPYNTTGGAVALSTLTAFTAVMAGWGLPGSSGNTPMTLNVAPSTATANYLQIGTSPTGGGPAIASTGADGNIDINLRTKGTGVLRSTGGFHLANSTIFTPSPGELTVSPATNQMLYVRTAATTGLTLSAVSADNSAFQTLRLEGNIVAVAQSIFSIGSTPASSGVVRLPNSAIAIVGKDANAVDDIIWPQQTVTANLGADVIFTTGAANTFNDGPSVVLGAGKWLVQGSATMYSTTVGQSVVMAKLWDGTTVLRVGSFSNANAATTSFGFSIHLSGVASTSSTWKISVASSVGATTGNHITNTDPVSGNTPATGIIAVKIG